MKSLSLSLFVLLIFAATATAQLYKYKAARRKWKKAVVAAVDFAVDYEINKLSKEN